MKNTYYLYLKYYPSLLNPRLREKEKKFHIFLRASFEVRKNTLLLDVLRSFEETYFQTSQRPQGHLLSLMLAHLADKGMF